MNVMSRNESRAQTDNQLGVIHGRPKIFLGQYSIDHNLGRELLQHLPGGIDGNGDYAILPTPFDLIHIIAEISLDTFHFIGTVVHSLAE